MAFPDDRDRELQRSSLHTLDCADDLIDWVGQFNPQRQRDELIPIRANDEFRLLKLRRRIANLYRSSRVPVAAAIYGPSQVGKSLFVGRVLEPQDPQFSPLGRDERLGPPAYQANLSFDYDLNPRCGTSEATAIVTRFTTKDRFDQSALQSFPVLVRALSRSEWLRVMARGFRSECEMPREETWEDSQLENLFQDVAKDWEGETVDRNWRMDLLDVYSYLRRLEPLRYRSAESTFNGLISRYPLSQEGYVEVAARMCWNNWPDLTTLFNRICQFLEKVSAGGHDGMLVHWAAVRFLLDSQLSKEHTSEHSKCFQHVAWTDLVDRIEDGWYVLDYQPGQGPPKEDLATIQSAMLEMVIPVIPDRLNKEWRHVIENIDFLDIPGMRAEGRGGEDGGVTTSAETLDTQMSIVKRGKVFYLFSRYIEELQAQTLLLLVSGKNLEVRGLLKEYVNKWGQTRYGKDIWPGKVRDDPPALFIGMTGIDDQFDKERAKPELYDARLKELVHATFKEIMTDFGGKERPFRNVYPIRYPGTWDYDEAGRQRMGAHKWEEAGEAFLASPEVQTYVENAEEKWAAAMRDGDGGTSLLARAFQETTSALRKQDELQATIATAYDELTQLSKSWVVDPDANALRDKRIETAGKVIQWLEENPNAIYFRVEALQNSLSLHPGDVFFLADIVDIRQANRGPQDDPTTRFPDELRALLDEWGTAWAIDRWRDYTARHADDKGWLDAEIFGALSRYLAEYLCSPTVFDGLCERLLKVVSLHVPDEGAKRQARRKYFRLILNDYIMQPGPNGVSVSTDDLSDADDECFGLMASFVRRWRTHLPEALAAGAGSEMTIPHGNDELIAIIDQF